MTLTVRSASVTGAVTAGRALTHAEMDANWAHVIQSANQNFLPSGTGAVARTVQDKLRDVIHAKDFGSAGSTAEVQLASNSLTQGLIWVTPGSTWAPSSITAKQNISYAEGRKWYSIAKANGEQFYSPSGEVHFLQSVDVVEVSQTGTGTDFTPSNTYQAIKFTTSSDASFVQGVELRVKKTGSLTANSSLSFALYTNVAGAPGVLLNSGSQIFAGQVTASYTSVFASPLQNVSQALTPSTIYWIVITRSESGGAFVLDSTAGTGSFYQGAALGTLADTNSIAYYKLYARSEYPIHTVGQHTHGGWFVSISGVGVRGDSTGHYGGYFQSVAGFGARGLSTYVDGLFGSSTYGNGTTGSTAATAAYGVYGENTAGSGGYPGVYGTSVTGVGVLANTSVTGGMAVAVRSFQGIMFGTSSISHVTVTAIPAGEARTEGDVLWFKGNSARGGLAFLKVTTSGTPGNMAPVNLSGVGADIGDAGVVLTVNASAETQIWATALASNRTITLSSTGAYNGAEFHIVRKASATGASTLDVGGLKTLAVGQWADVAYDGSAWFLKRFGSL